MLNRDALCVSDRHSEEMPYVFPAKNSAETPLLPITSCVYTWLVTRADAAPPNYTAPRVMLVIRSAPPHSHLILS